MANVNRFALLPLLASAALLLTSAAHAADPTTVDCLSASESSLKLRKEHKFREARQQLLVCAALTCPVDIRSECERRVVALNAAIPTLVFEARDAAGNDLSAVTISMDGKLLVDRLEGTSISIDPGAHTFRFEIAGAAPVEKSFVLREGEKDRRERIVFGPAATTSAPPAGVQGGAAKGDGASPPTKEAPPASGGGMSTLRMLGFVSGGVGIVGIGAGAVFAALASSASSDQQTACPSATNCPNRAQATSDRSSFATDSSVEIAGFVAGGVLLAAGVVMVIAGGNKPPPEGAKSALVLVPSLSRDGAGLVLRGGF